MNPDGPQNPPTAQARLFGKVALISGAGSSGPGISIGRAISILYARSGARVALVDLKPDEAELTKKMIVDEGRNPGELLVVQADVTVDADCRDAVRRVLETWGRIDVLVNSVGVAGPIGSATDVVLDEWDRTMAINVKSVLLMARHAIPEMVRIGGGAVINLSSIMGLRGGTPMLAYGTAKGAIINMTRAMAFQHGPDGIRVNCIVPGHVYTPMAVAQGLDDAKREARRLRSLLQTEGTPWDVGYAAVFLGSDEARWITGIMLPVDGGYLAAEPRR
ncbi:MAG TPA: SDR family oxidoreductase [bacterium]|nr:SDR family oxidoreductase [bacterium]